MKKLVFAFAMIFALSVAAVSCTDKNAKSSENAEAPAQVTDTLNNAEVGDTLNAADAAKAEQTDAATPADEKAPADGKAPVEEPKAEK